MENLKLFVWGKDSAGEETLFFFPLSPSHRAHYQSPTSVIRARPVLLKPERRQAKWFDLHFQVSVVRSECMAKLNADIILETI